MENSILSKSYWVAAAREIRSLRRLVFAALICALGIVVGSLYLPVGDNLRVKFTFFITAVGCSVYGPLVGMLVGAVTDTLRYVLFPSGAYFPGYMLSEMAGALIYGLLLYRRKITVLRLFTAKLLINYLVNVGMGCLWSQILYGKGYIYYMTTSLIKNSLLLPLEVMALAAMFGALLPVFSRLGLLPGHEKKELQKLSVSASAFTVFGLDCLFGGGCSIYFSSTLEQNSAVFVGVGVCLILIGVALLIAGPVFRRRKRTKTD